MPACTVLRPANFCVYLTLFVASAVLTALGGSGPLSAQMAPTNTTQSELAKKPVLEQSSLLVAAVRTAWKSSKCTSAKVSLEKIYDNQSGGWLVLCEEGHDYWALVRDQQRSIIIVQPCILARQSGTDCYANLRTVQPEDLRQCASPVSGFLDRVIRSCTTVIQSHQFDAKPDAVFYSYLFRALAFGGYQQYALAIADFDKAVALRPSNIEARFNRAVTLERMGEFDQALVDLAEVVKARPNDVNGLFERGYVYLKKGDYDQAIGDFDQVPRIDPQFDKAIRSREEAVRAKERPGQPSAAVAAAETMSQPTNPNEQAAYCVEASFAYARRLAQLLEILRANRETGNKLLESANLPAAARTQLHTQMIALNDSITANDAKRATWQADVNVFATYLQTRNLFTKDPAMIASMSSQVQRDQEAVQSTYRACLRSCAPNDASCKGACNDQANSSDASKRMLHCSDIVMSFK